MKDVIYLAYIPTYKIPCIQVIRQKSMVQVAYIFEYIKPLMIYASWRVQVLFHLNIKVIIK